MVIASVGTSKPSRAFKVDINVRRWLRQGLLFLAGAALWGVLFGLIAVFHDAEGGVMPGLLGAAMIGLLFVSMGGFAWFRQHAFGTYGHLIKFVAFVFLAGTLVGMLPIAYWTGRALAIKLDVEPWFDGGI